MLAADTIAINRLRVSGDALSTRRVAGEMARNSWAMPLPPHLQEAWILVRQLEVAGKPREIKQLAARELREQLESARDARLGGLDAANAIWFSSFPALLSFLLVDLALGRAARWYWQQWAHLLKYTRRDAIAQLLCEHIDYLPAVIANLIAQGQFRQVWLQLDDSTARTLSRELLKHHGLPPLDPQPRVVVSGQLTAMDRKAPMPLDVKLVRHWAPLVAHLPIRDGRVQLAGSLIGLVHAPLALANDSAAFFDAFTQALKAAIKRGKEPVAVPAARLTSTDDVARQPQTGLSALVKSEESQPGEPTKETLVARYQAENNGPFEVLDVAESSSQKDDEYLVSRQPATPEDATEHPNTLAHEQDPELEQLSASGEHPGQVQPASSMEFAENYAFFTQYGGFFYLLNPINRMLEPSLMASQSDPNGWCWLWDFHRLLARRFPILAELDWPLKRFLLQQIAPAATAAELNDLLLSMSERQPSAFASQLFAQFELEYQGSSLLLELGRELAEGSGFLQVQARVMATASHLDIYLPLNAVRLDLRLAAWDINPGWLPWLGRVVSFHYLEDPARDMQ